MTRGDLQPVLGTRFDFLEADETPLTRFRPSVRLLVAELILQSVLLVLPFAVAAAVYVVGVRTGNEELQAVAFTIIAPFLGIQAIFLLSRFVGVIRQTYFTEYIVTDRRAYAVTAIVSRSVNQVRFEKTTNLRWTRGLGQHVLGIAQLSLVAYGLKGTTITMRGVRNPEALWGHLNHLVRRCSSAEELVAAD